MKHIASGKVLYSTGSFQPAALWRPREVGWEGGSRRGWIYIYLWLIHVVQQKPTQHYKETILQLSFFLILEKESNFDICYNMDGPWTHDAKWNKPITSTVWFHLNEILRAFSIRDRRMVVFKSCGEGGIWSYCLIRTEFQFYKGNQDRWW